MNLIERIKADQLEARKSRDTVAAALLTTLIGEAMTLTDSELKDQTAGRIIDFDQKTTATTTKFLKNAKATREILENEFVRVTGHASNDGQTRPLSEETRVFMDGIVPKMRQTDREIEILTSYLPKQLSEAELQKVIADFRASNPDANVGAVMGFLKANYEGLYDGKAASQLARG